MALRKLGKNLGTKNRIGGWNGRQQIDGVLLQFEAEVRILDDLRAYACAFLSDRLNTRGEYYILNLTHMLQKWRPFLSQ